MAVPLFDTATPLAPLQAQIQAKVAEVLERGIYILGPEVQAFEREFADYLGVKHVVGVANGTDAITIALGRWACNRATTSSYLRSRSMPQPRRS